MAGTLHLEVNDAGGWRRVMRFSRIDLLNVQGVAGMLLQLSDNEKLRARIIRPGTMRPLMIWTRETGWDDWDARGGAS